MKCKCGLISSDKSLFRSDGKKCKKCHSNYNKKYYKPEEDITKDDYMIDLLKRLKISIDVLKLKR